MTNYVTDIPGAPKAVGPYSPAVVSDPFVFLSGQIGLDPSTGQMVEGGVEAQTVRVLTNIKAMLDHLGLDFGNVVKTTIFLTNMADFKAVNEIYASWLGESRPARSTVAVSGLPLGAVVEIEMLARR